MGELLNTLENRLPLRHPSILKAADKMLAISKRAEGSLGDTIDLVRECAVATIKLYRSKKIREEAISLALIKSVKWTPPSARRKFATSGDS